VSLEPRRDQADRTGQCKAQKACHPEHPGTDLDGRTGINVHSRVGLRALAHWARNHHGASEWLSAPQFHHRPDSALGAELTEGNGSRLRVALKGIRATFHKPHPEKEVRKKAVRDIRGFLIEAEVQV
jgi:hypothetical protein